MSVTCDRSVVYFCLSGFLHQRYWPSYIWLKVTLSTIILTPKDAISKFNWGHHNNTVNNFNIHAFSLQVHLNFLVAETHLLWIDVVHPAHWLMIRNALDHQLLTIVSMEDMKMHNTNDNISLNETIVYTDDSDRNSYISFFSRNWP